MKLLIALKSENIAHLLASSLTGYDVHIGHTGSEALALLESLRPESLIVDLSLPDINGLTLLRRSCHKPEYILALTNLATPAVLQEALDTGVQDVILIPCTVKHIVSHLTEKVPSPDI